MLLLLSRFSQASGAVVDVMCSEEEGVVEVSTNLPAIPIPLFVVALFVAVETPVFSVSLLVNIVVKDNCASF